MSSPVRAEDYDTPSQQREKLTTFMVHCSEGKLATLQAHGEPPDGKRGGSRCIERKEKQKTRQRDDTRYPQEDT